MLTKLLCNIVGIKGENDNDGDYKLGGNKIMMSTILITQVHKEPMLCTLYYLFTLTYAYQKYILEEEQQYYKQLLRKTLHVSTNILIAIASDNHNGEKYMENNKVSNYVGNGHYNKIPLHTHTKYTWMRIADIW